MGRRDLVTALALFGLALAYFSLTSTRTLDLFDEGYLLLRSVQVAAGAVPHRDFADVTDDHQWIHEDIARAQAGPFGTTIAPEPIVGAAQV